MDQCTRTTVQGIVEARQFFIRFLTLNQFQFLNLSNGMYTNVGSNLSSGTRLQTHKIGI